jgi:selenide,water dikinase
MPIGQLAHVLRGLQGHHDGRLLVGPETFDDAGVVDLGGVEGLPADTNLALVQTVDYFPPVVDDPYFYGAIAAANSLSDVYAMGGRPFSALNLAGIPRDFAPEWTSEIFRGGFEKCREAGAMVVGGHTIQSAEALFGYAITGFVDRRAVATNAGAEVGDVLYLTKRLGTGALTTAGKQGKITWAELLPAARQMAELNDRGALALNAVRARAATDITGFGLAGHARNIARSSKVTLAIELARVPLLERALDFARAGVTSGGSQKNRAALADVVSVRAGIEPALVAMGFEAETSGGLLICVPAASARELEAELSARDVLVAAVGEVRPSSGALVEFE